MSDVQIFCWFVALAVNVIAAIAVFQDAVSDNPLDVLSFTATALLTPANIIIASLVMRGGC